MKVTFNQVMRFITDSLVAKGAQSLCPVIDTFVSKCLYWEVVGTSAKLAHGSTFLKTEGAYKVLGKVWFSLNPTEDLQFGAFC